MLNLSDANWEITHSDVIIFIPRASAEKLKQECCSAARKEPKNVSATRCTAVSAIKQDNDGPPSSSSTKREEGLENLLCYPKRANSLSAKGKPPAF